MATREQQLAALAARRLRFDVRLEWLGNQFMRGYRMAMDARIRLAAQLIRDKVVINISTPVRKYKGPQGGTVVDPTSRSREGEFPHADTTRLMGDIFYDMRSRQGSRISAIVGTTLDYGLILETTMNRSYLRKTMDELQPGLRRVLTGPGNGRARFD